MTPDAVEKAEIRLRQRLAENVRAYRRAAKLTLKQAGSRAEIHWRHWQKIEAAENNATIFTLTRLADALNVDPADLLREGPPPEAPES